MHIGKRMGMCKRGRCLNCGSCVPTCWEANLGCSQRGYHHILVNAQSLSCIYKGYGSITIYLLWVAKVQGLTLWGSNCLDYLQGEMKRPEATSSCRHMAAAAAFPERRLYCSLLNLKTVRQTCWKGTGMKSRVKISEASEWLKPCPQGMSF